MPCPENDEVQGTVTGFGNAPDGGEFAYVQTEDYGPVTVMLNNNSWRGAGRPQKGEIVLVSGLSRFPKGWRAAMGRKYTLADENTEN